MVVEHCCQVKNLQMARTGSKYGQMASFMARNSKWPENIFYGQGGSNMAKLEKSGHQMARLATLLDERLIIYHICHAMDHEY